MNKETFRIVFMGTPDFAVESLKQLVLKQYNIVGVVTNPDKPAGRGQKIYESPIKQFAKNNNIPVLQPDKFRSTDFLTELKSLKADLQIVVAFKMLPEIVWNMPKYGTFNLHASLLPQYRGAAPINWAIINGETETGVTTFFLEHEIDTGNVIFRERIKIQDNETAGSLHNKMMIVGGELVCKTVDSIISQSHHLQTQSDLFSNVNKLKPAPKIFKDDCKIDWTKDVNEIYNLIRGLSPYPAAWTELHSSDKKISFKIFSTHKEEIKHDQQPGTIISDNKSSLKVTCKNGYINIVELQQAGKKRLNITDFLRGFKSIETTKFY